MSARPYDVVYLDPPYNRRDYGSYYHLPEAIVAAPRPKPLGRSGRSADRIPSSRFCSRRWAEPALIDLVRKARARVLVVHYSDDGLVKPARLREILGGLGRVTVHCADALGYSTGPGTRRVCHAIYVVTR